MNINSAVCIVTGAAVGVGAACAVQLAKKGARVVINYRNKEARALKLVAALEEAGAEAITVGADLTDPESVAGLVEQIAADLKAFSAPVAQPLAVEPDRKNA